MPALRRRYEPEPFRSSDPLIADFVRYLEARNISANSIVAYQRDLEDFGSFLKGFDDRAKPGKRLEPPFVSSELQRSLARRGLRIVLHRCRYHRHSITGLMNRTALRMVRMERCGSRTIRTTRSGV